MVDFSHYDSIDVSRFLINQAEWSSNTGRNKLRDMLKSKIKSNILLIGMVVGLFLIGILFLLPLHERWY
jgi:hypothetical protein